MFLFEKNAKMHSADPMLKFVREIFSFIIRTDFILRQNFLPNQHFADVCKIIDVIDPKLRYTIHHLRLFFSRPWSSLFRLEAINWFLKTQLSEYTVLYQESQEVNDPMSRNASLG